jgi:hypothetical protein
VPDQVCATFTRWRMYDQRELPWLAGPGLSALAELEVIPEADDDLRVVQRFLVGGDADPARDALPIEHDAASATSTGTVPPDARAALVSCVERYFALLEEAYGELHPAVRDGRRRDVDALCERWQERLDEAADQIEERGRVVRGLRRPEVAAAHPAPQRRHRRFDRPAATAIFLILAFTAAGMMLYAVLQGWPMAPLPFEI